MHLQPHGHFEMQRQGQVLICRPSGPFNLAGAMAYEAAFSQQIAGLRDAPWVSIHQDGVDGISSAGMG